MSLSGIPAFSRGCGHEGSQGRGNGRGNRSRRGFDVSRGDHFGRGRGRGQKAWAGFSDQDHTEIMKTRWRTMYISSEGTDDLIIPSATYGQIGLAMKVLQQDSLDNIKSLLQISMFLHSCLLNTSNHHSVDTSAVFFHLASEKGLVMLRHIMLQPTLVKDNDNITSSITIFQTLTLPLLGLLTRQSLCQTAVTFESNRIYNLVLELCQPFLGSHVLPFVRSLLERDLAQASPITFFHPEHPTDEHQQHYCSLDTMAPLHCVLLAILRLIYQLVMRFPDSISETAPIERAFVGLVDQFRQQSEGGNANQIFLNSILSMEMDRLSRTVKNFIQDQSGSQEHLLRITSSIPMSQLLEGPGELTLHAPRNNNDHAIFNKIRIIPTGDEVLCKTEPFLPINNDKEPLRHFLPRGWLQHLDVYFRLTRQDMMVPLCAAIQAFVDILGGTSECNNQDYVDPEKLRRHINDDVRLNVYSNVKFLEVSTEGSRAGYINISFDQPIRVQGLDYMERREFWEQARRRLMQNNLICFVRRSDGQFGGDSRSCQVVLALVKTRYIADLAQSEHVAQIGASLLEPSSYSTLFAPLQSSSLNSELWFMIECPAMFFEAFRPVLQALQAIRPSVLPFGKYIAPTEVEILQSAHSSTLGVIGPPVYTTTPWFEFDLSVLMGDGSACSLDVKDPLSADRAVTALREKSSLDNTQALALVETLGREIALISGPPGTGKTKVGIDLMKVLLHNKQAMNNGPILVICYTNHALDQFLEHLLDEGYTNIARLGAQSKSHRLQEYNLKPMLIKQKKPHAGKINLVKAFQDAESAARSIHGLTLALKSDFLDWEHVRERLKNENPEQIRQFEVSPPSPIVWEDSASETPLRGCPTSAVAYERWATGKDLNEKRVWNRQSEKMDRENPKSVRTHRYDIPMSERPVSALKGDVWSMSLNERRRLIEYWRPDIIHSIEEELGQHQRDLQSAEERKFCIYDELRRLTLLGVDVIGMTTTGLANFHNLLESLAPKIILCEEAGEVPESHIMTALSSMTQHLILIGDHLQLRPQVWTYNLCSESPIGKKYNLDRSLFERLMTSEINPLPVSRLTIQHRMRPEISSLIKNILYPTLEDGSLVCQYPSVGGMGSNLFFMDHGHHEHKMYPFGHQSFSNIYEVEMIEALALYLIKNGYDQPGDIVVLTPYFGQLAKIRNHLKDRFVVLVDGRDAEWLDAGAAEGLYEKLDGAQADKTETIEAAIQNHITIRSINNYQGNESKIVLISLVRSDAEFDDNDIVGSVGFLRSLNRTNVLLSRAQHGMFLIGNAGVMAQAEHGIWPTVMKELRQSNRVGQGFPIVCKNHPTTMNIVCSPDDLQSAAPDGGCTRPCGKPLPCGHVCPRSCHPDDPDHAIFHCREPCPRLRTECAHTCQKTCGEECGECDVVLARSSLACGHVVESLSCWQASDLTGIICTEKIERKLSPCGHTRTMKCHQTPRKGRCVERCLLILECGHSCSWNCHGPGPCAPCKEKCTLSCAHTSCNHGCQTLCQPCHVECVWQCEHRDRCTLPCAAPCDRLPCNERCDNYLSCGHQCPSVCGEECPLAKFCPECSELVTEILVLNRSEKARLDDVDVDRDPLMVPPCGHALTMSTLDGMMDLGRYYQEQEDELSECLSYVGLKELTNGPREKALCLECSKPIGASFLRYGRPIKHAQLLLLMDAFRKKHNSDNKKRCEEAIESLSQAKDGLLKGLTKFKAPLCPVLTRSVDKRVMVQDDVLVGDLGEIASLYHIPWRHQSLWKEAIKPVEDALAFFGQSLAKRSPVKGTASLVALKPSPLVQDSQRPQGRSATAHFSKNPPPQPTYEELSQAIRTLDLEDIVRPDKNVKLSDVESSSLILSSVFVLAVEAMHAAGVESGWYWFVGDLIECCRLYSSHHKMLALQCGQSNTASIAGEMVLKGFSRKVRWMTERNLGGMRSPEEYRHALVELERAFYAEMTEQLDAKLGEVHDRLLDGLEEDMMVLLEGAKLPHEE